MSNRLKDIFSNDMYDLKGSLVFEDERSRDNFQRALEKVYEEGCTVPIEGIKTIINKMVDKGNCYPLQKIEKVYDVTIGPSKEKVDFPLNIEGTTKTLVFWKWYLKDQVVLETDPNSIVAIRLTFPQNIEEKGKHTIKFKNQFNLAKSIDDVIESCQLTEALLSMLYKNQDVPHTDEEESLDNIKTFFKNTIKLLTKISEIEKELGISFSPSKLYDLTDDEQRDIAELHLLLCQKVTVRLNAKLDSKNATITFVPNDRKLNIGDKVSLTFVETRKYMLLDQEFLVYTSNVLLDAIVKNIEKNDSDGSVKIFYGDTYSKPMYISYSGFKTQEEAKIEANNIHSHVNDYINAQTVNDYIVQELAKD